MNGVILNAPPVSRNNSDEKWLERLTLLWDKTRMNTLTRRQFLGSTGKAVVCVCAARCLLADAATDESPDAYCGLYCGACSALLNSKKAKRQADVKCLGCKSAQKPPPYRTKCAVRKCAIEKKVVSCGVCKEYPCAKFNTLRGDKPKYGLREKYLNEIRANGHAKWLADMKTRWTCAKCSTPFAYDMATCPKCGAKVYSDAEEFEAYKQTKAKKS